ncbi:MULTISPECIES: fumarylacetoacetate hydrolase family protein [Pantoea]|jgi:5-oxopent-3-ene-1,2,5-tricarboxylate decarboxylase/2-hydroxyhepta-2,4-diene-1,7-dioate isomerase|uniref:fumarylacetoacetate hydrolase family protein n=1 Tax=Pantoea TaxID=53335 RepID=UPI000EA1DD7C|nr:MULTISPECIES: fumarylacetoacetate hydrolase family protein [Pantoea]MBZ6384466.1 fumarylacetoacetate hydrolase family protein [Pantoea piersonii]MBZ6399071.1 fumarylacetoacetate hydrolase family protein [Pantoea piersonii]MBZ6406273.1 fumarylacetoacetate hydrolase family protein [Pantoea piersonii]MBZ6425019.1 fumarylacetoacetate hydrolase family protein [Pantoea piersonii]NYB02812.1 fumarylacetoacetate hydrolase family protein [Pantoea piersonii]
MKRSVFAVALNHSSQTEKWNDAFHQPPYKTPPKTPVWFIKPRNTQRQSGDTIALPANQQTYSGGTLAVVIGATARKVSVADAPRYIAGYALANELSLAEESFYRPAIKAKCRDGFCPIGEAVPLADVSALDIVTEVNGVVKQSWSTADLHRNAAELIAALSDFATLQASDVILLGTPQERIPVSAGDTVTIKAQGLPPLSNLFTDRESVQLQPDNHPTLFALGLNYADHAAELEFKAPEEPLIFIKAANTLTGDNSVSVRPDHLEYMHYEAELVVVIGKTARGVKRAEALDYVAGYTVCNDYAVRDYLENYYRPNLRVKSRDTLTPLLPRVTPREAVPDVQNLQLKTFVNGELTQSGTTRDMVFDVAFLIEYLSEFMTLQPGDMIATGTPKGLADVKPGDEVVVEVEGVGRLTNRIVSEQQFEESLK